MKKIVLALLLLILNTSSFAQKIRFSDSTNVWKGLDYDWTTSPPSVDLYTASYISDSIINGYHYKLLLAVFNTYYPNSEYYFIREDTIASRVFARNLFYSGSSSDTIEQILYDYNWLVGDTVNRYYGTSEHYQTYIEGIDSTMINGIWHKVWHFMPTATTESMGTAEYYVIEGMGCISDPLLPLRPMAFENGTQLTCFANNGTTPFVSPMVDGYFDNATSCTLAVNDIIKKNKSATVLPNPISIDSKITLPYSISSGTLVVLNDIGQTIINTPFQNKDELLIGDKITTLGIFFYRVTDKSTGNVFAGKFVYR